MRAVGLGLIAALGGCDFVFGLEGDAGPCPPSSFGQVTPHAIVTGLEDFSVSWDRSHAIVTQSGLPLQISLDDNTMTPIDLGGYDTTSISLAPEDQSIFFTNMIEPPELAGATRAGDIAWTTGARVPPGTFAGTPSADVFGPRRVLVRLYSTGTQVQEYEVDNGLWKAHGDPHDVDGGFAPNLAPNGLSMVYAVEDDSGANNGGVYLATRASMDEWFGTPVVILAGNHRSAQLLGNCSALYTLDTTDSSINLLDEYDQP